MEADGAALEVHFRDAWRAGRAAAPGRLAYGTTDAEARAFWYAVVRDTVLRAGLVLPDEESFLPSLFDAFATAEYWRLYDDVHDALALAESLGMGCGVLSNWDWRLRPVLEALGLAARLGPVIVSADAGAEKPDPLIFEFAARAIPPSHAGARPALIGDEPDADGEGASRAGWRVCLIDRAGRLPESTRFPRARTLVGAVECIARESGVLAPPERLDTGRRA